MDGVRVGNNSRTMDASHHNQEALENLLSELIKIESHQETPGHEKNIALFIKDYFEKRDIDVELQEVVDGRPNVIATVAGNKPGPTVLLNGHIDTVPPYEMEAPFIPVKKNDKIFGRGSVDMKGALAAMMEVLSFVKQGDEIAGNVIFAATVGEENYSPGAYHLLNSGIHADYIIVGEPTEMEVGIAHKGVVWGEAIFEGRSVHGSVPEKGINAIYKASDWIQKIQEIYIPMIHQREHPILGKPSINIGEINGGTRPVIVPNRCTIRFEQRLLPGEKEENIISDLQDLITQLSETDEEMKGIVKELPVFHGVPHRALETNPGSKLALALCYSYEQRFGTSTKPKGLEFWTDGALLGEIPGAEAIVCGPGSIEQAHSNSEYIPIDQLNAAFGMYLSAVISLCKKEG